MICSIKIKEIKRGCGVSPPPRQRSDFFDFMEKTILRGPPCRCYDFPNIGARRIGVSNLIGFLLQVPYWKFKKFAIPTFKAYGWIIQCFVLLNKRNEKGVRGLPASASAERFFWFYGKNNFTGSSLPLLRLSEYRSKTNRGVKSYRVSFTSSLLKTKKICDSYLQSIWLNNLVFCIIK